MTTLIEHSILPDAALHEPKGIAAATVDQIYVANGSGSGAWTSLSGLDPFGHSILHVQHRVSNGVGPGNTGTGWQPRTLNTAVTNEITGASLGSDLITLPIGDYFVMAYGSVFGTTSIIATTATASLNTKLRLYDDVADTSLVTGHGSGYIITYVPNATSIQQSVFLPLFLCGRFSLAASHQVGLQNYIERSNFTSTLQGRNVDASENEDEVYSDVMIWKL